MYALTAVIGFLLFGTFFRPLHADQDFVQYQQDLDDDMADANLEPGSLDEAIYFARLMIKLGSRVDSDAGVEMNHLIDATPRRVTRILRQYKTQLDVGLPLVEQQFRAIWQLKKDINDRTIAFMGPLMQRLVQQLAAATGDAKLARRLGAALAQVDPKVKASMYQGDEQTTATVDNFLDVAWRSLYGPEQSLGLYVTLARFTLLEIRSAFVQHEGRVKVLHGWIDNLVLAELDALS